MESIEISPGFRRALSLIEEGSSVFITGKAGTGKSTLLGHFRDTTKKRIVVLAPTGVAAVNVGGQTIHSFFRFPPHILDPSSIKLRPSKIFKQLEALVIDEVSMVSANLMDAIDAALRKARYSRELFGGVQLILFGDLYQLPPIVPMTEKRYGSPYFFSSEAIRRLPLQIVELTKVYRQKDHQFISFLDAVRKGAVDNAHMDMINARVTEQIPEGSIMLTTTNASAHARNQAELRKLPGPEASYEAELDGNISPSDLPVDFVLQLKKGSRVMFLKNDPGKRWYNGTLGTVADLGKDWVDVKTDDGIATVGKETWEKIHYQYDAKEDRITAAVTGKLLQIPLRLAWAVTIHKSQSQTLDNVYLDFSPGVWEYGQAYVALSRCRTLEGISLGHKLYASHIKTDPRIRQFMARQSGLTEFWGE